MSPEFSPWIFYPRSTLALVRQNIVETLYVYAEAAKQVSLIAGLVE